MTEILLILSLLLNLYLAGCGLYLSLELRRAQKEDVENQIEEEKLKQLADGFSAYDLLYCLSKNNKYIPVDIDLKVAYEKAKEMIIYMRKNKND